MCKRAEWLFAIAALVCAAPACAAPPTAQPWKDLGRAATPAEIKAWDIDVRGDFKGLPPGSGSVTQGQDIWEARCTSCHGVFGESNEVFTPLIGGTTKADIASGRVASLTATGVPHRTTFMKLSKLSSLWDYIHRAMPWNAPKSLSADEVYAVTAYLLSLADIVPPDYTLNDRNIADVQQRLPNRDGKVFDRDMWEVSGKGDVRNIACMTNCPVDGTIITAFPDNQRGSNGNLAMQNRLVGPVRGIDSSQPPRTAKVGVLAAAAAVPAAAPIAAAPAAADDIGDLLKRNSCTACHSTTQKIVGPAFQEVARKYAGRADAVDHLTRSIRSGGQGTWGQMPMPAQSLDEKDARSIARWIITELK